MAVSYLSTPIKSNPYILPVSLDLMSQVLMYKDQQYNQGVSQVRNQLDQLASMDLIRGVDKQYLNQKINTLTDNINNMGGVDFSDPNVLNQIQSMGSSIYGDQKIINARAGTIAARNVLSTYDNWMNNPKMKGMYSDVNKWNSQKDMEGWLNGREAGQTYNGPTQANPFKDVDKELSTDVAKMKAQLTPTISADGTQMWIEKGTNKTLTEQDIKAAVRARVMANPELSAQADRNARYLTEGKGLGAEQVIGGVLNQNNQEIQSNQDKLRTIEANLAASVSDPKAHAFYLNQKLQAEQYDKQLRAYQQDLYVNGLSQYDKNPRKFQSEYYLNNLGSAFGRTFQVNEQTRDVKANPIYMQTRNLAQKDKELAQKLEEKLIGAQTTLGPHQQHLVEDPTSVSGYRVEGTGLGAGIGNLRYVEPNTATNLDQYKVNAKSLLDENKTISNNISQSLVEYLKGIRAYSTGADGKSPYDFLFDGDKQLAGIQQLIGKGNLTLDQLANARSLIGKGLSPQQGNFLADLGQKMVDMSLGKDVDITKLPAGFDQLFQKVSLANRQIDYNKGVLDDANSTMYRAAGLTPQERQLHTDYLANPQKYETQYTTPAPTEGSALSGVNISTETKRANIDPRIAAIEDKLNSVPDEIKNKTFNDLSLRPQFAGMPFSATLNKKGAYDPLKSIAKQISADPSVKQAKLEQMTPVAITKRTDGTNGYELKMDVPELNSKGGKTDRMKNVVIPLNGVVGLEDAFGLRSAPPLAQMVAREVASNQTSKPIFVPNDNGAPIQIKVSKIPGTNSYVSQLITNSGLLQITPGVHNSAEEALEGGLQFFRSYNKEAKSQGKTFNFRAFQESLSTGKIVF